MADRRHVPVPLSRLSGGLNRFVEEAGPNQCADCLDVINDSGEVRRRDAFVPVGSGPPHILPAGAAMIGASYDLALDPNDITIFTDRRAQIAGAYALYFGVLGAPTETVKFDGVDYTLPTLDTVEGAEHLVLDPQYWNGDEWVSMPSFVDETRDLVGAGAAVETTSLRLGPADGIVHYAILNGTSHYIYTYHGFEDVIGGLQNLTLTILVTPDSTGPARQTLWSKRDDGALAFEIVWLRDDEKIEINIGLTSGGGIANTATGTVPGDVQNRITLTYDGTESTPDDRPKVYVGTSLEALTVTGSAFPASLSACDGSTNIGAKWYSGSGGALATPSNFFKGDLDEPAIWLALTADSSDVAEIYGAGGETDLNSMATFDPPDCWLQLNGNYDDAGTRVDPWTGDTDFNPSLDETYVDFDDMDDFDDATDFAIAFLIKLDPGSALMTVLSNMAAPSTETGQLRLHVAYVTDAPVIQLVVNNGTGVLPPQWAATHPAPGAADEWFMVGVRFASGTVNIVTNGVSRSVGVTNTPVSACQSSSAGNALLIGVSESLGLQYRDLEQRIDQLHVWVGAANLPSVAELEAMWSIGDGWMVRWDDAGAPEPTQLLEFENNLLASPGDWAGAFVGDDHSYDDPGPLEPAISGSGDPADTFWLPFQKPGRIYWHTDQFAADWETSTLEGITAYWVRIVVRNLAGEVAAIVDSADMTPDPPGLRLFQFAPVNAIFPVRIENCSSIVVTGDRRDRNIDGENDNGNEHRQLFASGVERGAQLGIKIESFERTHIAMLLEDEGPVVIDELDWPQPTENGTPIGSSGLTFGEVAEIRKTRETLYDPDSANEVPYEWALDQWRGGQLTGTLTPVAAFDASLVRVTASGSGMVAVTGFYRHCRIRCTTAGGVAEGDEREIVDYEAGTTNVVYVEPDWDTPPNSSARFVIYGHPFQATIADRVPADFRGERHSWAEVYSNTAHVIIKVGEPYAAGLSSTSDGSAHIRIGRELRWGVDAALRWSGVIDTITGRLICTNGNSGLLEYDGHHIRRLQADFRSIGARALVGALPDAQDEAAGTYRVNALSLLRRFPPNGRYVVVHQSRIFVAGFGAEPFTVRWSAPGGLNNVWPLLYEDIVRDREQDAVVGMATLDERLIVFTPTAIHEALGPDDNGRFSFNPVAQGIGFVAHQAVCAISGTAQASQLVGVAPDGIYAYASGEPTIVLDDWRRLLPDGVNQDSLERSVAVAAPQKSWALFAVPGRGSATNNRILVWDYFRNNWWVWNAPFGISSLAVDYDEAGKERILFGTDDGYIMTLGDNETDDGTTIDAFAMSPFVQPFNGQEVALSAMMLTARTLGANSEQQMSCDIFTGDDGDVPLQAGSLSIDKGDTVLGQADWDEFLWAKRGFKTVRLQIVSYAKAHRFAYRVGGSVKWAVKGAEMIVQPRSRSGR